MSYSKLVLIMFGLLALGACSKSSSSGTTSNAISGVTTTSQISAVTAK